MKYLLVLFGLNIIDAWGLIDVNSCIGGEKQFKGCEEENWNGKFVDEVSSKKNAKKKKKFNEWTRA